MLYLISDEKQAKQYQTFLHHPDVRTCILKFKEKLAHNLFLQVAIFITIASLLTPIILFIIFAITSTIFVFIGFMMVQGKGWYISILDHKTTTKSLRLLNKYILFLVTVLAIGASILSCILFCITSTIIMVGLFVLFVYCTLHYTNRAFNLLIYTKT